MAGDRDADQIQRDIEQARASLAAAVDELTIRTSPKRIINNTKQSLIAKAQTPEGKAVLGGIAVLIAILLLRRMARH